MIFGLVDVDTGQRIAEPNRTYAEAELLPEPSQHLVDTEQTQCGPDEDSRSEERDHAPQLERPELVADLLDEHLADRGVVDREA